MAKVSKIWTTSEKRWYEELKVIAPYREFQYDRIIQSQLQTLFPDYYAIPYGRKISQPGNDKGSKPDFAMIRKDFAEWWIVEIERIEDKISHVRKQIEDFTNGEYNAASEAKYLQGNCNLTYKQLYSVTVNIPKVMLIVDDMTSKWKEELKDLAPTTCIFKVYRNNKGIELYSISGDYPYIFEDTSHCHIPVAMNNLLFIVNPDILDPILEPKESIIKKSVNTCLKLFNLQKTDSKEVYWINHLGQVAEWKKVIDGDKTYLQPLGPISTRVNDSFILKRSTSKKYILERN